MINEGVIKKLSSTEKPLDKALHNRYNSMVCGPFFFTTVLCAGAMVLVYELTVFGVALFVEQTYAARVTVALITAGLSCLAIPLLYPILVSIGKIGGETWKE